MSLSGFQCDLYVFYNIHWLNTSKDEGNIHLLMNSFPEYFPLLSIFTSLVQDLFSCSRNLVEA